MIFVTKTHYSEWSDGGLNFVRTWLLLEIIYFFFWLLSGMIFCAYAFIAKFRPISKNEVLLDMDDNVWNDKNTEDFLRYMKYEYFKLCYFGTLIMMEVFVGFSNLYHLDDLGPRVF